MVKDCFSLFKIDYNEQTARFEKGQLNDVSGYGYDMDRSARLESQTNISRMMLNNENETISNFIDDPGTNRAKRLE